MRHPLESYCELIAKAVAGPSPGGRDMDSCRAILASDIAAQHAFTSISAPLEGMLGDRTTDIDDTQILVGLLKDLAQGEIDPSKLMSIE